MVSADTISDRLIENWQTARDGADFPLRSSFRPMSMGRYLSNTYILAADQGQIYYRLAGSEMEHIWGRSLGDQNITVLMSHIVNYNIYHGLINHAMNAGCGFYIQGVIKDIYGNFYDVDEVVLPYLTEGDTQATEAVQTDHRTAGHHIELIGAQLFPAKKPSSFNHQDVSYTLTKVQLIPAAEKSVHLPPALQMQIERDSVDLTIVSDVPVAA